MVESFDALLTDEDHPDRTLAIEGDEHLQPILDILEGTFDSLNVRLVESGSNIKLDTSDAVALLEGDDVVATSSMEALRNAVLLINSDLYRTGLSGIDTYEAPDVITELDDTVYTLHGFPASTKEKLLLIVISRYIERRALEAGDGRLDVAFQKLSRIEDEYGTERIYQRLANSEVDVHAYGVPDSIPDALDEVTFHTGRTETYRRPWFVVFSPSSSEIDPAALLAIEIDRNVWRAMWTYDPDRISAIRRHIDRQF